MKPFKHRRVSVPPYTRRCFFICLAAFFTLGSFLLAQETQQLDRNAVLGHLNAAINWYRDAIRQGANGRRAERCAFIRTMRKTSRPRLYGWLSSPPRRKRK